MEICASSERLLHSCEFSVLLFIELNIFGMLQCGGTSRRVTTLSHRRRRLAINRHQLTTSCR